MGLGKVNLALGKKRPEVENWRKTKMHDTVAIAAVGRDRRRELGKD